MAAQRTPANGKRASFFLDTRPVPAQPFRVIHLEVAARMALGYALLFAAGALLELVASSVSGAGGQARAWPDFLRLILGLASAWATGTLLGVLLLRVLGPRRWAYRWLVRMLAGVTALGLVWFLIRVATRTYMGRIEATPALALYALTELTALLPAEIAAGLRTVSPLVLIGFGILLIALFVHTRLALRAHTIHAAEIRELAAGPWAPVGTRAFLGLATVFAVPLAVLGALLFTDAQPTGLPPRPVRQAAERGPVGQSPFPEADFVTPPLFAARNFAQARFGLRLDTGTNVVFLILESAREPYVELERTQYFKEAPETVRATRFFAPVPHSSNSHYSLWTGQHSKRDFDELYSALRPAGTLPGELAARGYQNYYLYADHTSFENEHVLLKRLGLRVTEKRDLMRRVNPDTGRPYEAYPFGMDDAALVHEAAAILDERRTAGDDTPFTMALVFTNSHFPYFNPRPDRHHRFDDVSMRGRHRNAIDYNLALCDQLVDEFRKRGLDGRTLFVLLADHGESFGERGFYRHSFSIYNEEVRVPLVLRHRSFARLTVVNPLPAGTMVDVFPTVFDVLGLERAAGGPLHGRSLFDPDYELRTPLWVWRLDDFRGLVYRDAKWIYDSLNARVIKLDLEDNQQGEWSVSEPGAEAFVSALTALDLGKAGGVAAAAGDRLGRPVREGGPLVFGAGFKSGGGRFR